MYIVICTCFFAVLLYMYITVHSTWTGTIAAAPFFSHEMGTQKVPFYAALRGILPSTTGQEQERVALLFGPRVHLVKTCIYIYPRPPVASYSNPKKSQSCRLQHSCIVLFVLAYFKCFLGALARGLFL